MAVLVKPKNYDWKDSNLALFGSDAEKNVKKDSAKTEPAWHGAGQTVGLQIWRIVNFKVTEWPKEQYGKFYNGDSYIILNTYKENPKSDELAYNAHFWIGEHSTQDEYGTAAYKTVELDTYLDDKAVQYREVEGHESQVFLSYFIKGIQILEGGAESGFHHVEPHQYTPRLFHFQSSGKNVVVTQIPACKTLLKSGDVFILDLGLKIYQWNGSGASVMEKTKALAFVEDLKRERSGKAVTSEVIDEDQHSTTHSFYNSLTQEDVTDHANARTQVEITPHLYRVSDDSGEVVIKELKTESISKQDFVEEDVFIYETKQNCFVWIGKNASPVEKQNGFSYAHNHLMKTAAPFRPIIVLKQGQETHDFKTALAA